MNDFHDLISLYQHLENYVDNYKYSHQIATLFQKLQQSMLKENDTSQAEKAKWEIDVFNFVIKEGKLLPMISNTDEEGKVRNYPDLENWNDSVYEYFIERLNNTAHPILKARYAVILWHAPAKYRHGKYAKMAVDSYLEAIKLYSEKEKHAPDSNSGLAILNFIENAYHLAIQVNYRINDIKSEIWNLVLNFNDKKSYSLKLRIDLLNLMLNDARRFSKEDFKGMPKKCWQLANSLYKESKYHQAIEILLIGEKIDRKLSKKIYLWSNMLGKCYEALMNQSESGHNPACLSFCQRALQYYKKSKNEKKFNQMEKKYEELKKTFSFPVFKDKIDLTEHIKRCEEIAQEIAKKDPEEIIEILMLDKNLLPEYKDIESYTEEQRKRFFLSSLFSSIWSDESGNVAQHFETEDEKKYFDMLRNYKFCLELDKIFLINAIFLAAIQNSKLTTESMIQFMHQHCWYGKTLQKYLANNQIIQYNWLNLLAPALHDYFFQMKFYLQNKEFIPNFVLCIDSLVLKIEGLLRDICRIHGVSTTYTTTDNKGRNIDREKDIQALLKEEQVKALFDEDDLIFFRFLLVAQAGYNLRHRIAHSLMIFQEYRFEYMPLLILAILRLGKYDLVCKK